MDFYTPVFSKIVDSSLWAEPDFVCKMFVTLLALKDKDFVVRHTAFALGKRCWPKDLENGVAERRAMEALKVLSEPDKSRIEPQPFEGRRIEKVDGGWKILNGENYRNQMQRINEQAGNAKRQQAHRDRQTAHPNGGNGAPKKGGKSQKQVQAENESRSRRAEEAEGRGDRVGVEDIATEGT